MYCSDYHCSHWIAISGDPWPDDDAPVRLAAGAARMCGPTGNRLKNMPDKADVAGSRLLAIISGWLMRWSAPGRKRPPN